MSKAPEFTTCEAYSGIPALRCTVSLYGTANASIRLSANIEAVESSRSKKRAEQQTQKSSWTPWMREEELKAGLEER
jgi:hypothetical protein